MPPKKPAKAIHLNEIQHPYKRPDAYIGSVETVERKKWIYVGSDGGAGGEAEGMVLKEIKFNPGLCTIVREIVSNAIDNRWRSTEMGMEMTYIYFTVDAESGYIEIKNDGAPLPVRLESTEFIDPITQKATTRDLYPAELCFGYMRSGTNFDDTTERKTSGTNGLGAKATSIFSKHLVVTCADAIEGKVFTQEFSDNLTSRTTPVVTKYKKEKSYTSVRFLPDYERFGYPGLDKDLLCVIRKMAYDTAMVTGLKVRFNDEKISLPSMNEYVRLFYPDEKEHPSLAFTTDNGDECVLVQTEMPVNPNAEHVAHVSFVNGINTSQGGVHIDAWQDSIFAPLVRAFNKKYGEGKKATKAKKPKAEEKQIKTSAKEMFPYFCLFVRCELDSPRFDTQTKETLNKPVPVTTKPTDAEIAKILKWSFVEHLEDYLKSKMTRTKLKKDPNALYGLGSKLQDANLAGKKGSECTLFVTEGQSAKTLVCGGIAYLKRHDMWGVYAVRGKMENTFDDVGSKKLQTKTGNLEIRQLIQILGLEFGVDYSDPANFANLRYKRIEAATDADDDGLHIRGLLLATFLQHFPSLFRVKGFFSWLSTPVIRTTRPEKRSFWTAGEFQRWDRHDEVPRGGMKYYKGLGTNQLNEIKEIFKEHKFVRLKLDGEESEYAKLAFASDQSDWRKEWILRELEDAHTAAAQQELPAEGVISVSTFLDRGLSVYHTMTLRRALPCVMDAFKESTRKILEGIVRVKLKKTQKVDALAGAIASSTQYHHALSSLCGAISNQGVGIVGTNNIPLLQNAGMYGSRIDGASDKPGGSRAAPRYIETMLEAVTKTIFLDADRPILDWQYEDGMLIEPKFFLPVICMPLINGVEGIASGFSTKIPCYNPTEISRWHREWLNSEDGTVDLAPLKPWYRGFKGTITLVEKTVKGVKKRSWVSRGILSKCSDGKWWEITELPIGLWTAKMKDHLDSMRAVTSKKTGKVHALIKDVREYHTNNTVHFKFLPAKGFTPDIDTPGNMKLLQRSEGLDNMYLLDVNGVPRKYATPEEILQAFCPIRLSYYEKRRKYLLALYKHQLSVAKNKYKFIKFVLSRKLDMHQSDEKLDESMLELGLEKLGAFKYGDAPNETDADAEETSNTSEVASFKYLLDMQMRSMTEKRLTSLQADVKSLEETTATLKAKTGRVLWLEDLDAFDAAYARFLKTRDDDVEPDEEGPKRKKKSAK